MPAFSHETAVLNMQLKHATSESCSSHASPELPSHTRVLPREVFTFLIQPQYTAQVGVTPMSDFRSLYKADFDIIHMQDSGLCLEFGLKAVKPSRIA